MKNWSSFLIWLILAESVGASLAYFLAGDWRKGLYWLSASGIAISFLF